MVHHKYAIQIHTTFNPKEKWQTNLSSFEDSEQATSKSDGFLLSNELLYYTFVERTITSVCKRYNDRVFIE